MSAASPSCRPSTLGSVNSGLSQKLRHVQDGGLWINLGPLLYHWADSHLYLTGQDMSIEVRDCDTAAHPGWLAEKLRVPDVSANVSLSTMPEMLLDSCAPLLRVQMC